MKLRNGLVLLKPLQIEEEAGQIKVLDAPPKKWYAEVVECAEGITFSGEILSAGHKVCLQPGTKGMDAGEGNLVVHETMIWWIEN